MSTTATQTTTASRTTQATTLCAAFQTTVREHGDKVALRTPDGSVEITYAQYGARVRRIAAGLAALGVRRGDTVALLMSNRPEFHLVDAAALHLGAIPFSVYATSSPEQIAYLFENAGNDVVVCEPAFRERIEAARGASLKPGHVIDVEALDELETGGDAGFDFDTAWRSVEPADVATLIYTSGTTGPPKGVELTHANMLAQCYAVAERLPIEAGDSITSYLPSAHIADRWSSHYNGLVFGIEVTCVPDPRQVVAVLSQLRPTLWGGVPRVVEKLKAALEVQGITDPAALPEEARAAIRAKIGLDRAKWIIIGAAPLSRDVHDYLLALGLPVTEIYGMSECSCCVTVTAPAEAKVGSVGTALDCVELTLAEDGELLVRGDTVMRGYRGEPEKTAEAIDAEGWLHTGDVCTIEDGYVRIVDRKKELIINAAGKNMSPANIEQQLKGASPLIGQAAVIGDRRPYNVALLVLDPDVAAATAEKLQLEDRSVAAVARDERVRDQVAAAVEAANARLSRVEQVKRWELLAEEWLPGGDELTPTMKLKRKPIAEKYAAVIDGLYA